MKQGDKLKSILNFLKNKYIIATALFVVLMIISQETNIFYFSKIKKQKHELEQTKEFYINQIAQDSINTVRLQKNIKEVEKYGREKFLMKRDNEDIFIIRNANDTLLNADVDKK